MKAQLSFLTAVLLVSSAAFAGEVDLSCDESMELQSSYECAQAVQMALAHVGCNATELGCSVSNSMIGYDCSAKSDVCVEPGYDDSDNAACPDGYEMKNGAGDSLLSELTSPSKFGNLFNSRHTAESWAASRMQICKLKDR